MFRQYFLHISMNTFNNLADLIHCKPSVFPSLIPTAFKLLEFLTKGSQRVAGSSKNWLLKAAVKLHIKQ
jgi:hypothetical protein